MLALILFLALFCQTLASVPCAKKDYGNGNIACVCNEKHCDTFDPINKTESGVIQIYTSSKSGKRFEKTEAKFSQNNQNADWKITIDKDKKHQKIIGFGGSFTDAAVLGIGKLPEKLKNQIIYDYFSENGLEYSMCRMPIAGSDFSTRAYSYDDVENDFQLNHFKLAEEDINYKIPQMKLASKIAKNKLIYFGSPWSGPIWLKTSHKFNGSGTLKEGPGSKYWKTYANYLLKWLQSYRKNGIEFWGMTVQNEPAIGFNNWYGNNMGFTAKMESDFLKVDLGPLLEKNGWTPKNFSIMIMDFNRDNLPNWPDTALNDPGAALYVAGIAVHWYVNSQPKFGIDRVDETRKRHPDRFLLATEACEADWGSQGTHIALGRWHFGQTYAHDIIKDLNHYFTGWIDWNMVLDMTGGPIWGGHSHSASAPIIVNHNAKEYYKNPMYYAMGHFSKFLPPDSQRIEITPHVDTKQAENNEGIQATAFQRPDGGYVFIVINTMNKEQTFTITDKDLGHAHITVQPNSFSSMIYYQ